MYRIKGKKGVILIFVIIILVALMGVALAFWYMVNSDLKAMGAGLAGMKAFYIAEAGRAKARWAVTKGGQSVPWQETNTAFGGGTYTYTMAYSDPPTNQHVTITSTGYFPNSTNPIARRQVVETSASFTGGGSGENLSIGATAHASSNDSKAKNINDAKTSSQWKADNKNQWEYVTLDFGSQKQFSKVVVNGDKIDQRNVKYSTDGVTYMPVMNLVESPAWTFTFDSVSARYVKLEVYGNKPEVNELETYGGAGLGQGKFGTSL